MSLRDRLEYVFGIDLLHARNGGKEGLLRNAKRKATRREIIKKIKIFLKMLFLGKE